MSAGCTSCRHAQEKLHSRSGKDPPESLLGLSSGHRGSKAVWTRSPKELLSPPDAPQSSLGSCIIDKQLLERHPDPRESDRGLQEETLWHLGLAFSR